MNREDIDRSADAQRGLTLVELTIAVAVFTILGAAMSQVTTSMLAMQAQNATRTSLHTHALRAMRVIISDLKQSSFVNVGGKDFPFVFDKGFAAAPFSIHSHTPATANAVAGEPGFGPSREIVFVLPDDPDQDGKPNFSGANVLWSSDEISYTLVTDEAGNALLRSTNGTDPATVARHVERVVFDTPTSSGFAIPLGTVRVQLFLRKEERQNVYRYQSETTVRLQFGNM